MGTFYYDKLLITRCVTFDGYSASSFKIDENNVYTIFKLESTIDKSSSKAIDKINLSSKNRSAIHNFNISINETIELEIMLNKTKTIQISGSPYNNSVFFKELIWIDAKDDSKEFEILSLDIQKEADEYYLYEDYNHLKGKPVVRVVLLNNDTADIILIYHEIQLKSYNEIYDYSVLLSDDNNLYQKMRDQIMLNYDFLNFYDTELNIIEEEQANVVMMTSLNDEPVYVVPDYTTFGSKYLPSLNITITDNLPDYHTYYLDCIFPTIDMVSKLIDESSWGQIKLIEENHTLHRYERSWTNALTPNQRSSVFIEYEIMGSAEKILLTLKYCDYYVWQPLTRKLVYGGISRNCWLQEFSFRLEGNQNIKYVRLTNAGLYKQGSWMEFDLNSSLNTISSIGGFFSLSTLNSIFDLFADPGAYVSENNEYTINNTHQIVNQYNTLPYNINKMAITLVPTWVLITAPVSTHDFTLNHRWKTLSIELCYDDSPFDDIHTIPTYYRYYINFKRSMVFGNPNHDVGSPTIDPPIHELVFTGATITKSIPIGC